MCSIRVLVAWLLMAALPLQGLAASSMLFCGQITSSGHGLHHEHAVRAIDTHAQGTALHAHAHDPGAAHAGHAQDAGAAPDSAGAALDDDMLKADSDHGCPICASCCAAAAVGQLATPIFVMDAAAADLPQPTVRILARATPRPDKPPRA